MDPQENPWTTLSSEIIYENPWIKVIKNNVINPSGNKGIYGYVHFRKVAVGIIPLDPRLNTWLVGQYRYTLEEYSWEIPMGGGALDVPILESAQRELKEETGFTAKNWEYFMKIHTSNSVTDEAGHVFLATELEPGPTEFDETEKLEIKMLPLSKAVDMAYRGEITDSLSLAALLKAKIHFQL